MKLESLASHILNGSGNVGVLSGNVQVLSYCLGYLLFLLKHCIQQSRKGKAKRKDWLELSPL